VEAGREEMVRGGNGVKEMVRGNGVREGKGVRSMLLLNDGMH
jgi:hypothetical protein